MSNSHPEQYAFCTPIVHEYNYDFIALCIPIVHALAPPLLIKAKLTHALDMCSSFYGSFILQK
jgi:hypothetical protein